ncbi:MAG: filamentous hemagglutinin N-terminal domain-containing protein, partial [Rhizobacter sp.]
MNPTFSPRPTRRKAPELRLLPIALAAALVAGGALAQPVTNALPVLNPGSTPRNATIGAQTGTNAAPVMNINQNAARGVIEWQSFDIGAAARVNIVQPTAQSVLVNRVINPSPSATSSQIYGTLSANGRVFLVNPAGITFGATAQVAVGSLVASTLDLTPAMTANNYDALVNPATTTIPLAGNGSSVLQVQNGAVITTDPAGGGSVVLVHNGGVGFYGRVDAVRGRVAMGVGVAADVVLPVTTSGFVDLVIAQPSPNTTFIDMGSNSVVNAEGGSVILGSRGAGSATSDDNITLGGLINVGSTTGTAGSVLAQVGDGSNAGIALMDGAVIAARGTGAGQTGGSVTLQGRRVTVQERSLPSVALPTLTGASIDVSGSAGGGTIDIGGATSRAAYVGSGNLLSADALTSGNGGRITVTANYSSGNTTDPISRIDYGVTEVYGTLAARGGLQGGNGGRIETSGQALTTRLDQSGSTLAGRI